MDTDIPQNRINGILEKLRIKKRFYETESEGLGPCCILLLGHARIYDSVIKKLEQIRPVSVRRDLIFLLEEIKQEAINCSDSGMHEIDSLVIRTYEEIIRDIKAVM